MRLFAWVRTRTEMTHEQQEDLWGHGVSAHLVSGHVWLFYKLLARTNIRNTLKAKGAESFHRLKIGTFVG